MQRRLFAIGIVAIGYVFSCSVVTAIAANDTNLSKKTKGSKPVIDEFLSRDELIKLLSGGRVLCFTPQKENTCSTVSTVSSYDQVFVNLDTHIFDSKLRVAFLRLKLLWDGNKICAPKMIDESRFSVAKYDSQSRDAPLKTNLNPVFAHYSDAVVSKFKDYLNQELAGVCLAYKYVEAADNGIPVLWEYSFAGGIKKKSSSVVHILPAGSQTFLYEAK